MLTSTILKHNLNSNSVLLLIKDSQINVTIKALKLKLNTEYKSHQT